MHILTRRVGEGIRIDGATELVVLRVDGGKVRIGIRAPRDVVVDRQEIAERKRLAVAQHGPAVEHVSTDDSRGRHRATLRLTTRRPSTT